MTISSRSLVALFLDVSLAVIVPGHTQQTMNGFFFMPPPTGRMTLRLRRQDRRTSNMSSDVSSFLLRRLRKTYVHILPCRKIDRLAIFTERCDGPNEQCKSSVSSPDSRRPTNLVEVPSVTFRTTKMMHMRSMSPPSDCRVGCQYRPEKQTTSDHGSTHRVKLSDSSILCTYITFRATNAR